MKCKTEHFQHILLFYFCKGKKAAEAHNEICEVYDIDCLTERLCQNQVEKMYPRDFILKDDHQIKAITE